MASITFFLGSLLTHYLPENVFFLNPTQVTRAKVYFHGLFSMSLIFFAKISFFRLTFLKLVVDWFKFNYYVRTLLSSTMRKYRMDPLVATGLYSSRAVLILDSVSDATNSFLLTSSAVAFVSCNTRIKPSSSTREPVWKIYASQPSLQLAMR